MELASKWIFTIVIFLMHAENMLFHNVKMHQEESDQSKDKWFQGKKIVFAVWFIVLVHAFVAYLFLTSSQFEWYFWLGTLLFFLGYALRTWSYRLLGRFFTFEIGIRDEHKIIDIGPYAYVRHPSYSAYILMVLGVGIQLHSLPFLIIATASCLGFFSMRIHNEEQMLSEHFGEGYTAYQKRTKKLIPFIF